MGVSLLTPCSRFQISFLHSSWHRAVTQKKKIFTSWVNLKRVRKWMKEYRNQITIKNIWSQGTLKMSLVIFLFNWSLKLHVWTPVDSAFNLTLHSVIWQTLSAHLLQCEPGLVPATEERRVGETGSPSQSSSPSRGFSKQTRNYFAKCLWDRTGYSGITRDVTSQDGVRIP